VLAVVCARTAMQWLTQDVGIGGHAGRGFDPSALIQFAWRLQIEGESCDDMYHLHHISIMIRNLD
jgi:hypothetical protein